MTALRNSSSRIPRWLIILLIAMAGLMLEVGYTRIVSYKLWYYYTYLVIGLSLLGIGSGGILVAIWKPLKKATTERIVAVCATWGALSIAVGYWLVARLPVNTVAIWRYGTGASFENLFWLGTICLVLFATFIAFGIIVATLLGRAGEQIGRLYFADLVGAGLGCFLAIPFITWLGPPEVIIFAALVFAVVGLLSLPWQRTPLFGIGAVTLVALVVLLGFNSLLPEVKIEAEKENPETAEVSEWGPVFRVDVMPPIGDRDNRLLLHDGSFGSGIWEFDGDETALDRFDGDARSLPFSIMGDPPERNLIIGSAGGNEILASLYYGVENIDAVELNPVTVGLLKNEYREITGNLVDRPEVNLTQGDGRTYLARSDNEYGLVWFVAPDSYAANNAASSGAFVLSESYLYTTEMIEETLDHLEDDGMMVVQFGELRYQSSPNRTGRYINTAREALRNFGVENPSDHMIVSTQFVHGGGDLSTIILKRTPFTPEEVERYDAQVDSLNEAAPLFEEDFESEHLRVHAPGLAHDEEAVDRLATELATGGDGQVNGEVRDRVRSTMTMVSRLAAGDDAEASELASAYKNDISPISDDAPFFWHFSQFDDVLKNIFEPIDVFSSDPEEVIGERVLLLLLAISAAYAALFLFLPFVTVRSAWRKMPFKGNSGIYFACLGLGFMLYEITMIQRLVLFLGYPTLSLTVTLAAILVFTGIGALLSDQVKARWSPRKALPVILGVLTLLTLFYQLGMGSVTDSFLSQGQGVRILIALLMLAPLGLCLGMFMPLGLGLVSRLTNYEQEYVAWSWAINGFFSVIGSVLTTILSMAYGFTFVQYLALAVYVVAVVSFFSLHRRSEQHAVESAEEPEPEDKEAGSPAEEVPAPSPA